MPSIIIKNRRRTRPAAPCRPAAGSVFDMLDTFIVPGVTTMAINDRVEDFIVNQLHARPPARAIRFSLCVEHFINDGLPWDPKATGTSALRDDC